MRLFGQGFPPDDVFAHRRHEAAQKALPDLVVQLRAAANVKDGYELRQELIGHVCETAGTTSDELLVYRPDESA